MYIYMRLPAYSLHVCVVYMYECVSPMHVYLSCVCISFSFSFFPFFLSLFLVEREKSDLLRAEKLMFSLSSEQKTHKFSTSFLSVRCMYTRKPT
ncbi:hypothetical protein CSUI_006490, partial [Cystoisospora suis]